MHGEVMGLIQDRRLWGRGVGRADAAAALLSNYQFRMLDRAPAQAAAAAGVNGAVLHDVCFAVGCGFEFVKASGVGRGYHLGCHLHQWGSWNLG